MEKIIFKYKLERKDIQEIEIPGGAEILCLQIQNEQPHIWALVDPKATPVKRTFKIVGTGEFISEGLNMKHIGSFQMLSGLLIFHCFELF